MEHKIPQAVIDAAKDRAFPGGKLICIGIYKGYEVYNFKYDEPMTIGMPKLYLYKNDKVSIVEGESEAFRVYSEMTKP